MKNKKVKVFFNKLPEKEFYLKNYFPFAVLFKNFNVEIVRDYREADIIFEMTVVGGKSLLNVKDQTVVVVSGENIFMKRNVFNWLERAVRLLVGNEKKYKIMDKLNAIIPYWIQKLPVSSFFSEYTRFARNVNKNKNHYVIWCSGERNNKKIFNYPLFLADFHHEMGKLIKRRVKVDIKNKKFCVFVVSSNSARERVKFFKMLSKYKKVDSYGHVMNNMGSDFFGHWRSNPELFSNYKFVICFENSFAENDPRDDVVTEKITNAMLSGAIPVYRGPTGVRKYFNTSSFINYSDCGSYKKMIKKIIELDRDDEKYRNFLKRPWFHDNKVPAAFKNKEKELVHFYRDILRNKQ